MLEHTWWIANSEEHALSLAPVLSYNQCCLTAWGGEACNLVLPAPRASFSLCGTACAVHVPYKSLWVCRLLLCAMRHSLAGLGAWSTPTWPLPVDWYANLLTAQYGGKEMGLWLFKCQETERNIEQVHGQPGPLNFPLAPHIALLM